MTDKPNTEELTEEEFLELVLEEQEKGMGFCFEYWNTKKNVLAKYGIEWRNPHIMNPRVMFD